MEEGHGSNLEGVHGDGEGEGYDHEGVDHS